MSYNASSQWINPFQTREQREQIVKKLIEAEEAAPAPHIYAVAFLQGILEQDQIGEIYVSPDGFCQKVKHKIANQ